MALDVSNYVECALIDGATKFVALLLEIFISKLTRIRKKKRSNLDSLSLAQVPKALFRSNVRTCGDLVTEKKLARSNELLFY